MGFTRTIPGIILTHSHKLARLLITGASGVLYCWGGYRRGGTRGLFAFNKGGAAMWLGHDSFASAENTAAGSDDWLSLSRIANLQRAIGALARMATEVPTAAESDSSDASASRLVDESERAAS